MFSICIENVSECLVGCKSDPAEGDLKEYQLRDRAITTLQLWLDGVVPLGQSFVVLQSKGSNLIPCGLETARIEPAVEVGSELKSGLGLGGTGVVEDLLVGI